MNKIHSGNACEDGPVRNGWLVGHFMPDLDLRKSDDVEIKWGQHAAGETREEWVIDERRMTFLALISGKFTIIFPDEERTLEAQGDYLMWGPGVDHTWHAEEDSVMLTVRWNPSL